MDLGAYAQISELEEVAKRNNIYVPRLRGYRLMKDEKPDAWDYGNTEVECAHDLCTSIPFWNPNSSVSEFSSWTRYLEDYYIAKIPNGDDSYIEKVRWDRIHGKKRRVLKTYIHNEKKKIDRQREMWNKYAGREDVLYIHARLGGGNWSYYHTEVDTQPWFLEKVDDSIDSSYCDIYAKIKVGEEE